MTQTTHSGAFESPNPENTPLLNREQAAELVSSEFFPCAPRTFSQWPVPYIRLGRWALYKPEDVRAEALRRIEQAPHVIGGTA